MDRILIILKKENGPRASTAPALGLNTIIFKHVYWYMQQIQDHWSSGSCLSQLPEDRLLKEVFEVDKNLFQNGYKSWYSCIHNFMQKFSVSESEAQTCTMSDIISTRYKCDMNIELSSLRRQIQDNKLFTFSIFYPL